MDDVLREPRRALRDLEQPFFPTVEKIRRPESRLPLMDFTNGEIFGVKLRLIASAEDYGAR